ncbi:MAG TPA: ribokinase [Puia sp.]|jgi:ribokinase|nr:ribokinase [Puia sp.]
MKKIIVAGSANTDMVVKTKKLPLPGETILGGNFFMNRGGKGANQAVAAARLGGHVGLVAKLGNDIFGKLTLEGLKKEGINTDYIFIDEGTPSGTALIIVDDAGENIIVVAPGANGNLLPSDINTVNEMHEAEIILTQLEIPMSTVVVLAQNAKANNQKMMLNPAPAQSLDDMLLKGLFLITPNETEASLLTGIKVFDEKTASQAARVLLNKGVLNVIITLGRQGAYFQNDLIKIKQDAPEVQAVDSTAAGDTFNGALAVALSENMDWQQAIGFAVKAASISVTRLGAQASIPYRNEIWE